MCKLTVWLKEKYFGKKIKIGFYVEERRKSNGNSNRLVLTFQWCIKLSFCFFCVINVLFKRQ